MSNISSSYPLLFTFKFRIWKENFQLLWYLLSYIYVISNISLKQIQFCSNKKVLNLTQCPIYPVATPSYFLLSLKFEKKISNCYGICYPTSMLFQIFPWRKYNSVGIKTVFNLTQCPIYPVTTPSYFLLTLK